MIEINKLIESHYKPLREIGWVLYNCNAHEFGISKDEVSSIIKILSAGYENDFDEAYEEGFEAGKQSCDCE